MGVQTTPHRTMRHHAIDGPYDASMRNVTAGLLHKKPARGRGLGFLVHAPDGLRRDGRRRSCSPSGGPAQAWIFGPSLPAVLTRFHPGFTQGRGCETPRQHAGASRRYRPVRGPPVLASVLCSPAVDRPVEDLANHDEFAERGGGPQRPHDLGDGRSPRRGAQATPQHHRAAATRATDRR
jgi:hypothetical protein